LKFSALIIGYSIWFLFSKNENIIVKLPINISISKPDTGKININDNYFAELELNRILAMAKVKNDEYLNLFFDVDNLNPGEHKLNTETGLIVTNFQPKIVKHNLPNVIDCLIY
jgi:hypothetical protein